jgi:hypothetical protein
MDADRFDSVARALHFARSRRASLRLLASGALGVLAIMHEPGATSATHFSCRHIGVRCRRAGQCCSGICRGRSGRKRCKGHDAGICTGQNVCTTGSTRCGEHVPGTGCFCFQTTGDAPFCGRFAVCRSCSRDKECEEDFGPGAACVVHDCVCGVTGGTGCVVKCNDPD